jgi:hypothetical protein
MIDSFALALTHALLALTAWRLLRRADLDADGAVSRPRPRWGQRPDA